MSEHAPIDPAWRAEWAQRYAQPLAKRASRDETAMLRFALGSEAFALPVSAVWSATEWGQPVPLPGRRGRVVWGLFHVDGQLILAADLRRLLHPAVCRGPKRPGDQGQFARTLVLGKGSDTFAVCVDDVPGTFRVDSGTLQPLPLSVPAPIAALSSGMVRQGAAQVAVLDGDRLLAALAQDLK